jgi:hypothetical protein
MSWNVIFLRKAKKCRWRRINLSLNWFDLHCISSWNRNSIQSELLYFLEPRVRKVLPSVRDSTIFQTSLTKNVKKRQNAIDRWAKLLLGKADHNFFGTDTKGRNAKKYERHTNMRPKLLRPYAGNSNRENWMRNYLKYFEIWMTNSGALHVDVMNKRSTRSLRTCERLRNILGQYYSKVLTPQMFNLL